MRGNRHAALANAALVALKVAIILAFVEVGLAYLKPALLSPFVPETAGSFGAFGWSGVLRGAGVVFFAYVGFETVACAVVLTGLVPCREFDLADPIAKAIDATGLGGFAAAIKLGALIGLATATLTALYGQCRIFYAMALDRMLRALFARVHPGTRTP